MWKARRRRWANLHIGDRDQYAIAMVPNARDSQLRATLMYWQAMSDLKLRSVTMRLDRDRLARAIRSVEAIKAIATSGGVAGWVIWKNFPLVWSCVVLAAQVLDALKHVLP